MKSALRNPVPRGPLTWTIESAPGDRRTLLAHKLLTKTIDRLGLRGSPQAALKLSKLAPYREPLTARHADIAVSFLGYDRYWMRHFFRGDAYEMELYSFFARCKHLSQFHFIDGGANIGYWSALLTSQHFGHAGISRAVAVEASTSTFAQLARTAALCHDRFAALHCALSDAPGTVTFDSSMRAESRKIVAAEAAASHASESIAATTVDTLIAQHRLDPADLLIKLDVEGAEFACIRGSQRAWQAGAIFIYEDHGKDPRSVLTAQLLDHGAACWSIDDHGRLHRIGSAADASAVKRDPKVGYNFVATASAAHDRCAIETRLGL